MDICTSSAEGHPAGRWEARAALGVFALTAVLCGGCRSHHKPQIEIIQTPVSSVGGPSEMEGISGKVRDAHSGEQVVLYARSGVWWLQPLTDQPYTKIQADGSWKNLTHLGSDYAALLVESGYRPASKLVNLPPEGEGVLAVAMKKGAEGNETAAATVHFSGQDWTVQSGVSDHGGQPYAYDPANAWTDEKGHLHLRMDYRNGRWACAEVSLDQSLGYGRYSFVVEDSSHLRPSAVLGMFTWDGARSTNFRNELDIELSRWGDAASKNAQYVVQPFYSPDNLARFDVPGGVVTYVLDWEPGAATFQAFRGDGAGSGPKIYEHAFHAGVPSPGNEKVHMDLYDFHHTEALSGQPQEAVIESFSFTPANKGS